MLIKSKVLRFLSHHQKPTNFQSIRTFLDNIEIKFVPDRGLDHAVEKEKDLKFVLNLKNLLKNEPSKSLSLSSIVDNIDKLGFPCRAIDFILQSSPKGFVISSIAGCDNSLLCCHQIASRLISGNEHVYPIGANPRR